ncbi:MAG TPA: hypothetical protein VH276_17055 [Solirubrobacteraceae bacterium]|nr:hypothetical protein [Solirubrobacteraceae bacterium]
MSGVPSTLVTLARREPLLDGVRAAGSLLVRDPGAGDAALLAAAVPAHLALSFGWAAVLAEFVPRGSELPGCVLGGLAIAALDLGVIAPRWAPRVRALPQGRQWADHVAFGLAVGVVLRVRRTSTAAG